MKLGLSLGSSLFKETIDVDGTKYAVLNTIGEGGFAFVYRVKRIPKVKVFAGKEDFGTEKHFALKKMICQTDEQIKEATAEIAVLQAVKHCNILPLLGQSTSINKQRQTEISLLLPLYTGGAAQGIIDRGKGYPHCPFSSGADVMHIIQGTIMGLQALHTAGFRHNDMKPGNILLQETGTASPQWNAVLTDFGSTSPLTVEIKNRTQALDVQDWHASHSTASIRAPELFDPPSAGLTIDGRADVWGLGATIYALLFSRTPFESPREGFSSLAALAGSYVIPKGHPWDAAVVELLTRCLQPLPSQRANLNDVAAHFASLPPPPMNVMHVFPPEPEKKPMPMWDGHKAGGISTGIRKSSTREPVTRAPIVTTAQTTEVAPIDWGDATFDVDFSVDITPVPAISAPMLASSEDEFGDFSSADDIGIQDTQQRSTGEMTSTIESAAIAVEMHPAVDDSHSSGLGSTLCQLEQPRDKASRPRVASASISSDGEGRPSDVDEFGDNQKFNSFLTGGMNVVASKTTLEAAPEDQDFGDFQ